MTKAESIAYKNLVAKVEKYKAKLDMVGQENIEYKKEITKLKTEIETLQKNNTELGDIATKKCDELYNEIAKLNQEVTVANDKKKEDAKTIKQLEETIDSLKTVITDLKSSKIKDSTNSNKPSSTNGYKKVIQNNRAKSDKSKGGQIGRKGKTLNPTNNPDEVVDVYGEDTCECGGKIIYSCEHIKKQVIDILNQIKVIEYRYHKGKCEKCGKKYMAKIPKEHANPIQYSPRIKNVIPVIRNMSNMSIDTTQKVFNTLFSGLEISTGWIHKQDKILSEKCEPIVEDIKEHLSLAEVAHSDETSIKIDDKLGCCICFFDDKAVMYGMFANKAEESFNEFDIYNEYSGILVHDHNKMYYKFLAMEHAECNVHILRYLKGVIDMFERKGATKLRKFLMGIYKEKLQAIEEGKDRLREERITEIEKEYMQILDEWENEYNTAIKEITKKMPQSLKDEKNLFTRLREYKEEHLRFIKNFKVPFSNNEAERNLRKIKMKINVSKRFGKLECAKDYAIIKTIIETSKKQGKDIFEVFSKISNGSRKVFELNSK